MKTKPFIAAALILLTACGVRLVAPIEADLAAVQAEYPDATLMALNEGKTHYQNVCSNCHALYNPADYDDNRWNKLVSGMSNKARGKGIEVSDEMETQIKMYLKAVNGK